MNSGPSLSLRNVSIATLLELLQYGATPLSPAAAIELDLVGALEWTTTTSGDKIAYVNSATLRDAEEMLGDIG